MTLTSVRPAKAGIVILILAVGCAASLAACGSQGRAATGGGSKSFQATAEAVPNRGAFLRFSECMRANGVANFPDPQPSGGINLGSGANLNPQSPAFQHAQQTCRKDLPGGGPPRVVPESVKLQMLSHAECMRAHGVSGYPDPTFPSGGGIENFISSGVEVSSPVFKAAAKACGGP